MLDSAEDEAIVMPGSLITTSLRKGEVEESDYVLVTVHKPSGDYLSQEASSQRNEAEDSNYPSDNSLQSSTYTDIEAERSSCEPPREENEEGEDEEESSESQGSSSSVLQSGLSESKIPIIRTAEKGEAEERCRESSIPFASQTRLETVLHIGSTSPRERDFMTDMGTMGDLKLDSPSILASLASSNSKNNGAEAGGSPAEGNQPTILPAPRCLGNPLEKKPPDKNVVGTLPLPLVPDSMSGPMALLSTEEEEPTTKVTFLIGGSMSPESDTESRRRKVEEEIRKHKKQVMDKQLIHFDLLHQQQQHHQEQHIHPKRGAHSKTSNSRALEDQTKQTNATPALQRVSSKMPEWSLNCVDTFDEYYNLEHPVDTRTIDDVSKQQEASTADNIHRHLLNPSGNLRLHDLGDHSFQSGGRSQTLDICLGSGSGEKGSSRKADTVSDVGRRCRCGSTGSSDASCCRSCPFDQDKDIVLSVPVPQDGSNKSIKDQKCKMTPVNDWEIPRNESSDSALGDSESEETEDWQEEMLVPFPG